MEFAHAGNDSLAGLLVGRHLKSRVLLGESTQANGHLLLVGLGSRLDRHRDNRLGKGWRFESEIQIAGAESVPRDDVLDPDHRADVAGIHLGDVVATIGLHDHETADAFRPAGSRVEERAALLDGTGVNPYENEFADEGIAPEFEGQGGGLGTVVRRNHNLAAIGIHALHRREIQRTREIVNHRIE